MKELQFMKDKFNKWITAIKKFPIAFIGCLILIIACFFDKKAEK